MKKITVFKRTSDNWCGNYIIKSDYVDISAVRVMYHDNISAPGEQPVYRTSVWGNDDLGMEIDCDSDNKAYIKFLEVIGLEDVTMDKLKELEFVSF